MRRWGVSNQTPLASQPCEQVAVAEATGRELSPHEFGGGDETNGVLRSLESGSARTFTAASSGSIDAGQGPAVRGAHHRARGRPPRQPLREVLDGTRSDAGVVDLLVPPR
jgi:hypothetical protein